MAGAKTIIRTTCPRDCYDACGIAVVKREGGLVKVLGDPDHPVSRGALCGKCAIAYNGVWLGPEGAGDAAVEACRSQGRRPLPTGGVGTRQPAKSPRASRGIVAAHGAETIWHAHYTGTCSQIATSFPQRFLNRLGASEVDPDSICNAAGHAAFKYMFGASERRLRPAHREGCQLHPGLGANPSASAPHQHKHWLKETRRQGHRRRPCAPSDSRRSAPAPAAFSRQRFRARLRHASCAGEEGRIDRKFLGAAYDRLG